MGLYVNITIKYKDNAKPDTELLFIYANYKLIDLNARPLILDKEDFINLINNPQSLLEKVDCWFKNSTLDDKVYDLEATYLSDAVEYEEIINLPYSDAESIESFSTVSYTKIGRFETKTSYNYITNEYVCITE